MKSSKNNKAAVVDDISRETQRLISESHIRLPYHKPKQKTLKDFLNRQTIIGNSTKCQASITGSKKLLQKAWEFIESKEKNVEKFYNEDSIEIEEPFSKDNIKDIVIDKELEATFVDSDVKSSVNKNSCQETSMCSEKLLHQQILTQKNREHLETNMNSNNFDKHIDCYTSMENKNESIKDLAKQYVYEYYDSSDYEDSLPSFVDDDEELSEEESKEREEENEEREEENEESEEENEEREEETDDEDGCFKKKKRKLILLSESSDEENDSITDMKLTPNDLKPLFNETQINISTQQLMDMCSGEFVTQLPQEKFDSDNDSFSSSVPKDNIDTSMENEDIVKISAKDFFEDEAELSESEWSSDDEENLVDNFEEEAGDKDNLDESAIKDGLDKIYMRQLLDDDQKQVTSIKEMLFEEGDLYSDSSRKRKFQWDETDENDGIIGKPLFSDNDDEDDELIDSEQWRNERFKRESYLSKKNKYADERIEKMYSNQWDSNISQSLTPSVKKTHVVKYQNEQITNISNNFENNDKSIEFENDKVSDSITVITNTKINTIDSNNGIGDMPVANIVLSKPNKLVKGSFINRISENKMNTTLLYINKRSILINNDEKCENNGESLSIATAKSRINPFTYLSRNDTKLDFSPDLNNIKKKDLSK